MALTERLDATAVALAHVLRANQAHAHPDERVDLARSPLVDGAFQAFAEAWDEFCSETDPTGGDLDAQGVNL